jgi:type VII secretion-associated protein (TIGR03931 family)
VREVVIEVGPGTIRGPNGVRDEWVCAAIDCIDDEIALLGDRPVSVPDVWNDVMSAVAGDDVDTVVLVCPAWWPPARIDMAQQAAHTVATDVVVLERIAMLQVGVSAETTIVEIAPDIAIVTAFGTIVAVVPRLEPVVDAEAIAGAVTAPAEVLIDAPIAVPGAEPLASLIVDRMRAIGVPVRVADDGWIRRTASAQRSRVQAQPADTAAPRHRKVLAVLSGALTAVALGLGVVAVHDRGSDRPVDDMAMTLLVEGRVGVLVPTTWNARRITSGPGSARVQVVSPMDRDVALHITQSAVAQPSSLARTADSLLAALAGSTEGAFVEFNPSDRRADREAVTYREIRGERNIAWTVVVDGTARIAIGCQSRPGREHLVREACDRAIRSAHAVAQK